MLLWNEQFETGHSLVDCQHRMFISYINRLEDMARNTNPSLVEVELFLRFIDFLETYILTHFREEEDCMNRFKCPVHAENSAAHQTFAAFFQNFKLRVESAGYHAEVVRELHESCSSWIRNHILRVDVQIKPCLDQASAPEPAE